MKTNRRTRRGSQLREAGASLRDYSFTFCKNMKILWKEVRANVLTLGYTGTRKSSETIKEIEKNRKIALSNGLLHLMLLIPILGGITVIANAILEPIGIISGHGTFEALLRGTIPYFFYCFGAFTFMHILLASSIIQHSFNLTAKEKFLVLIFGGYALDWNHAEHITPEEAEPDASGQRR
jgi:hypothetical protein